MCPVWFSTSVKKFITRILDLSPKAQITIPGILDNDFFKKDYKSSKFKEEEEVNPNDVDVVLNDLEENQKGKNH